jgi:membrane protein DedA with SNARE-associated domain
MSAGSRYLPWLLSGAAALSVANLAGIAFAPTLLTYHPLLLIWLSPVERHMVLVAATTPLVPFVLVSVARRTLTCALCYGIGRAYGEQGVAFLRTGGYPRAAWAAEALQRWVKRAPLVILLLAPWSVFCGAIGGATRTRFWWFLTLAVTGQLIWARLTFRVSAALSTWIGPITVFLREHVVSATAVTVASVAIYALLKRRERRGVAPSVLPRPDAPPEA